MAMAEPIAIPTEDPENIEENGRLSRSSEAQKDQQSLLRKRDSSWDKKWQQHLEKNVGEQELPRSSIFTRSPRLPGKVNRSLWETRLAQEANGKPQAKPNVIRNWKSPGTASPAQNKSGTASPRPHYGAALMDYSPSRNSTPSNLEVLPPLPPPPPPQKPHENEVEDTNEMPYVNNIEETDNDCGDWKDEVIKATPFFACLATSAWPRNDASLLIFPITDLFLRVLSKFQTMPGIQQLVDLYLFTVSG